jgi:predicted esterase
MVVARALLLATCAFATSAYAQQPLTTTARSASVASLFSTQEAAELSKILPPDEPLKFRVWIADSATPGVLVFVSPTDSGAPPTGWLQVLQRKQLSWIAAEGFGNEKPSAQRVLVALMALKLIRQSTPADPARTWIGGMSGGGRIASEMATRFPQKFSGALYIVGANFSMPEDARVKQRAAANRYVFITGEKDFNRSDMRRVFSRYQSTGLTASLLMDLPDFGHEYPNAERLGQAIDFLDAR